MMRPRAMQGIPTAVFLAGSLIFGGGCASFDRAWEKAALTPDSTTDFQGRWQGTWTSEVSHHQDSLRCLVTQEQTNTFQARFHAKYRKVFSFSYTVGLYATPGSGAVTFEGDEDL